MPTSDDRPVAQECVEGYLFVRPGPRILILRRPPARGGFWVPVSGKVDAADRTFESALRRELQEETGLTSFRQLFSMDWEYDFDGPNGDRWRLHAFGAELDSADEPRLSDEHDAFEWVDWAEAVQRLHFTDNQEAVRRLVALVEGTDNSLPRTIAPPERSP